MPNVVSPKQAGHSATGSLDGHPRRTLLPIGLMLLRKFGKCHKEQHRVGPSEISVKTCSRVPHLLLHMRLHRLLCIQVAKVQINVKEVPLSASWQPD